MEADGLPCIDKRYGEKCAALLWQLRQNEPAQEQQAAATRKSTLATKYGIAVPKSAGHRASSVVAAGNSTENALTLTKQQRPSSTRAAARKPSGNPYFEHAPQMRARTSGARAFGGMDADSVQLQQLEAEQADPVRAFSSPRPIGDGNRYTDDTSAELELVRDENKHLRLEIAKLHEKLMEKMRGGSKIVAGGQFRGKMLAHGAKNTQPPTLTAHCSTCATLHLDLKRSRHEHSRTQHITEELHREIAKMEAIQHMLWAENSAQAREITSLREAIDVSQQARDEKDNKIHVLEQQVSLSLAQATDSNNSPEAGSDCVHRDVTHSSTQYSPRQSASEQTIMEIAQRNSTALENEVARLRLELAASQLDLEKTFQLWRDATAQLDLQKSAHAADCLKYTTCEDSYLTRIGQLTQTLEEAQREAVKLRERAVADEHHSEVTAATNAGLLTQLKQRDDAVNELEATNRTLQNTTEQFQAQVDKLEARISSHSLEAVAFASQLKESQTSRSLLERENTRLQQEVEDRKRQLLQARQQVQDQQAVIEALGAGSESWKQKTESLEAELGELQARLQEAGVASQGNQQRLQAQISALEWESDRNDGFIIKLKRSHALALEQALHATIRLCVVAPTVTVHLSEMPPLGATKSDLVVCKPAPPRDRIRDIVENEILPHFTKLLVQERAEEQPERSRLDGDAGSSKIEPWVRDLLQSMQQKITEQLQGIYQMTGA